MLMHWRMPWRMAPRREFQWKVEFAVRAVYIYIGIGPVYPGIEG